jgi:uncharacterized protein YecE (DUF72 family)
LVAAQRTGMNLQRLHVGTMGWSYGFWKGNFYPQNLSSKEFLGFYAAQFNTVEVDSTFYRIPRTQSVMDWKQQTPPDFLFSLKFPKIITHVKMLKDCQEEAQVFVERVGLLQEKLGPLLLQFPYAFGNEHAPLLREFLRLLPKKHRYIVEIRNQKLLNDSFYSILRDNNVVLAWVGSPFMPLINEVTSDFVYIRWVGDRRSVNGTLSKIEMDKTADIKLWAERVKPFLDNQTQVFGYFSKYYSGYPPADIRELLKHYPDLNSESHAF